MRRLQKKGWGSGPLSPFLLRPPDSVRTYLLLIPWMKMASRAQQRRFASPSSLVTTASDVTYRFCRALSDWASFSLIYMTMPGRGKYYQFPCLLSEASPVRWSSEGSWQSDKNVSDHQNKFLCAVKSKSYIPDAGLE